MNEKELLIIYSELDMIEQVLRDKIFEFKVRLKGVLDNGNKRKE
jgi:hypothetical protein